MENQAAAVVQEEGLCYTYLWVFIGMPMNQRASPAMGVNK